MSDAGPLRVLLKIALRLVLCALVIGVLWWKIGVTALVLCSPLIAIALAKPILELLSDLRHAGRALQYRDVEGRYYAYKGLALDVIDDEADHRWVRIDDLRRVIDKLPAAGVLERTYPDGCRAFGQPPAAYLKDTALVAYLAKATAPETLKFRRWVEQVIADPARRLRERRTPAQ